MNVGEDRVMADSKIFGNAHGCLTASVSIQDIPLLIAECGDGC